MCVCMYVCVCVCVCVRVCELEWFIELCHIVECHFIPNTLYTGVTKVMSVSQIKSSCHTTVCIVTHSVSYVLSL